MAGQHCRHPCLPLRLQRARRPEYAPTDREQPSALHCPPDNRFAPPCCAELPKREQRMLAASESVEDGVHGRRLSQQGVTTTREAERVSPGETPAIQTART